MKGVIDSIRQWLQRLGEWMKPDPSDNLIVQIVKLIYKTVALLILIALSPVILVVLLFVFFAAV